MKYLLIVLALVSIFSEAAEKDYTVTRMSIVVNWIKSEATYTNLKKSNVFTQVGNAFVFKKSKNECEIHTPNLLNGNDHKSMEWLGIAVEQCLYANQSHQVESQISFDKRDFETDTDALGMFPVRLFSFGSVNQVTKFYRKLTGDRIKHKRLGFSGWTKSGTCDVSFVGGDTETLGHELTHCVLGEFHKSASDFKMSKAQRKIINEIRKQYALAN